MRETINEEVSVVMYYRAKKREALPWRISWQNKDYAVGKIGYYHKNARVPGLEGRVLTALDTGGFAALVELLTVYHLDNVEGYYQVEYTSLGESEGVAMAALLDWMELSKAQRVELDEDGVTWLVQELVPGEKAAQKIRLDAASTRLLDFLLLYEEQLVRWRDGFTP